MSESQRQRLKRRKVERKEWHDNLASIRLDNLLIYYACVQEISEMNDDSQIANKTADEIHAVFSKFESRLKYNTQKTIRSYGDGFIALYFSRDNVLAYDTPLTIDNVIKIIEEGMPANPTEESEG